MRARTLFALLLLALPATAPAAEGPWFVEYEQAQTAAEDLGKDLFIDFGGSDWCLPCRLLKQMLSQPEFEKRASAHFILLDIDDLHQTPMPEGRKERYQKLQQLYGVEKFPTVILATANGLAYAQTTYVPTIENPEDYWEHLQPLYERGQEFRIAFERSRKLEGQARAKELARALAFIHPEFVARFHSNRVKELKSLDPHDDTGYLAFLDARMAVASLQEQVAKTGLSATSASAVDLLIKEEALRGEALQDALVLRALCQLHEKQPLKALATLEELLHAQSTRSAFDRGDFIPLDATSIETVQSRIETGRRDVQNTLAQYYALHRVFEFELPDRFEICCGEGYLQKVLARNIIGEEYGTLLMDTTAALPAEPRAKAIGQGLDGTFFARQGSIKQILDDLLPRLVGRQNAGKYLPEPYSKWVGR